MPKFLYTLGTLLPAAFNLGLKNKRRKKICLFGADACGKTTFLYHLKLGRAVTTIPTIGFNVESVPWIAGASGHHDGRGRGKGQEWEFEFYDVGGCDRMASLMHHFIDPDTTVLFIHDCSSPDDWRLEFSVELLHLHIGQMQTKGAKVLLVLLSKQDAIPGGENERRAKVVELRNVSEKEPAKYDDAGEEKGESKGGEQEDRHWLKWQILAPEGLSGITGEGTDIVMDNICLALSAEPTNATIEHEEKETQTKGSAQRDKPLTVKELDVLSSEAMSSIQPADILWREFLDGTLVSWDHASHLQAGYIVLLECMAQGQGVFESAEVFLRHLARLREARPDHFRNTAHVTMTVFWLLQLHLAAAKYQAPITGRTFPVADQFREVVLHSSFLMDRGLWKTYYSKDLLFSPAAREEWHLPDLQPLPTMTMPRQDIKPELNPSDDKILNRDRFIEFAFVVIKKVIIENLRRGAVVKQALASLQRSTLQRRAKDPAVPAYSETQACFWIQVVHAALHDFVQINDGGDDKTTIHNITLTNLDLPTFKLLYSLDGDITWRQYYSTRLWQDDITARMQFVPSDLKPLPSIIRAGNSSVVAARKMLLHNTAARVGEAESLPSREVLDFLVDCLLHVTNNSSADSMDLIGDGQQSAKVRIDSHVQLMRFLHAHLSLGGSRQDTANGHQTQASSKSTSSGSSGSSSRAAAILDGFILGDNDSYTEKLFWARQVLLAASMVGVATSGAPRHAPLTTTTTTEVTLELILRVYPQLAFDMLPFVYYSPALWHSAEARAGFVPPDREALGSGSALAEKE